MAWLNINKEFQYFYGEKVNYEEEWDWDFNWCLDPLCPCDKQWDGDKSKLTINPDPMACDDLPFRERFKQRNYHWDWRKVQKVRNKRIWDFAEMVIENNIGKSFDRTFSYYLKQAKHVYDRHEYFFRHNFHGRKPNYYIDESGLIQKCVYPLSPWKQDWYDEHKSTKLYTFKSANYSTEVIHKQSGVSFEEMKQRDSKYWYSAFSLPKNPRLNPSKYIEVLRSGYFVKNVQPNSILEKRLNAEKQQLIKQQRKLWKLERKNKQYSFLTREEEEIKKARIQDNNVLIKHGFNEESFKGAPYHGRKNKKKC